jgi:hypothetical protein
MSDASDAGEGEEQDHRYDWTALKTRMIPYGDSKDGPPATDGLRTVVVVHIVVLVHGWLGSPLEMDSIQQSLERAASAATATAASGAEPPSQRNHRHRHRHKFVIHSATCNAGRTNDGIRAGGRRLAKEVNSLIDFVARRGNDDSGDGPLAKLLTLSLVGNSLGGLYARQAVADIDLGTHAVRPILFVTTATPHLGVSQHTYLPLPRMVEYPIAAVMDRTGLDLFRFTSTLEDLTSSYEFLQPLGNFRRRTAYVNVYGTDFQVPTPTAGFWTPDGHTVHTVVPDEEDNDNDSGITRDGPVGGGTSRAAPSLPVPPMIVMKLATERSPIWDDNDVSKRGRFHKERSSRTGLGKDKNNDDDEDPSALYRSWSERLDGLGWTKVLVDVREQVPSLSVGRPAREGRLPRRRHSSGSHGSSGSSSSRNDGPTKGGKTTWTAGEILREFGGGLFSTAAALRIPLGHTVMIANAKDGVNRWMTKGGRPVVDYLASSMVRSLIQQQYKDEDNQ